MAMKMKNQNLIRQSDSRSNLKGSFALRPKRFFYFFIAPFLAVCLTSVAYAEMKSKKPELFSIPENDLLAGTNRKEPNLLTCEAVTPKNKVIADRDTSVLESHETRRASSENDLLVAKGPTTPAERQLWQARMSVFKEKGVSQSRDELQQIIRRISSIELKPRVQTPDPKVMVEPTPKTEPNETVSGAEILQEQGNDKVKSNLPEGYVSEQTLQIFKSLLQQPDQLKNTLEMAEILFNSGRLKEAAMCYQQALNHMRANEADPFGDKAWILLQLGNCLQNENPQAALESYKAVIVEHPDSSWVPLAKAKSEMTDWYLQDQPKTLIKKAKP
jgi:tetratricopeptide (TPR) repeat protein